MRSKYGIEIENILPNSLAKKSGLLPGDVLLSINSHPLNDIVDFMFYKSSGKLEIEFKRKGSYKKMQIATIDEGNLGLTLKPFKIKTCNNHCLFCFVKQLPKGLRKSLYIKDEDYRMSFLYGNYITITNLSMNDRKRIIDQRLNPLYVSVHTTNKSLRNKILGNSRASDIMKELKYFSDRKIRMHIQIVLCPGFNDKKELQSTIKDIHKFYPYVSSIAVVPVGLTKHRKLHLNPVTKEDALRTIEIVESFQKKFKKKHGDPVVYCSDEFYIKAELPFPKLKDYGNLPQLENGVGMVPLFINQSKKIKIPETFLKKKKFLTFTGVSFYPFLKKFIKRLSEKENIQINVIPIENKFFGTSITATGLLTGRDVIKALHDNTDSYELLIAPNNVLKEDEDVFLDNVSLKDIEEAIGLKTVRTDGTPQGLIDTIASVD
jgi:putative radical SAM enzyme (TIGR03279 family)